MNQKITCFLLVAFILSFFASEVLYSQVNLKNIKKRTEKKIEKRVDKRVDKEVDKKLDQIEDTIDGKSSSTQESSSSQTQKKNTKTQSQKNNDAQTTVDEVTTQQIPGSSGSQSNIQLNWSKYDFVPGTEIFFEDNLQGERNGEFPSRWDLLRGNFEIAELDGENVIFVRPDGNMSRTGIIPMMKNPEEDYLPDEFTIQFDAFFKAGQRHQNYMIWLYDRKNQKIQHEFKTLEIGFSRAKYGTNTGNYPGFDHNSFAQEDTWRHIAISFNVRALKVYIDDARVLNIPNVNANPTGITISASGSNTSPDMNFMKNFRFAKGAVPLYDKALSEGRIVTHGIVFDVNRSVIKPESMGVINEIHKLLSNNPYVNFIIEGHTDSDGNPAQNLTLSESRANAVKEKLVSLGIAASRLETVGMGATKPMAENSTPEGKAQNRRVEFVRK